MASLIGFCTLIVAHHLAMSGDTLELMRAVLSTLVGTPPTDQVLRSVPLLKRTPGVIGLGLASFTVVEETGNGCHHMHTLGCGE